MNRKARTLMLLLFVTAGAAVASDYDLSWYTIDGGGVMRSTGGNLELSGTIGQPDANVEVLNGGGYELTGGFWPVFCFGDLDGDNYVDRPDLVILLSNYGMTTGAEYADGDLDDDGDVDLTDLAFLLSVYGTTCP
jgi:hypothetical protein